MNIKEWGKENAGFLNDLGKSLWAGCCRYCNEYLSVLNGKEFFDLCWNCRLSKMGFAVDESKMKVKVSSVIQTSNLPWNVWNSASPTSKLFTSATPTSKFFTL